MISVRAAERVHRRAVEALSALEERAQTDQSVTASELVEARASVDLAAGRIEGARRVEQEAVDAERQRRQDRAQRHRRLRADAARADQLAAQQRAIESGKAAQELRELAELHHSPDARRKLAQVEAWKASGSTVWPGYDNVEVSA